MAKVTPQKKVNSHQPHCLHADQTALIASMLDNFDGLAIATDGKGRIVDFRNSLVVMTSNLCQDSRFEPRGDSDPAVIREHEKALAEELGHHFRPEFLNRVDDVVLFKPFWLEEIVLIVDLLTADLRERLRDRGLALELSEAARQLVAPLGQLAEAI